MLWVLMKIFFTCRCEKVNKKGFRSGTFTGRFQVTVWQWRVNLTHAAGKERETHVRERTPSGSTNHNLARLFSLWTGPGISSSPGRNVLKRTPANSYSQRLGQLLDCFLFLFFYSNNHYGQNNLIELVFINRTQIKILDLVFTLISCLLENGSSWTHVEWHAVMNNVPLFLCSVHYSRCVIINLI